MALTILSSRACRSERRDDARHALDSVGQRLMLPDADYRPSRAFEPGDLFEIAFPRTFDLCFPERCIARWNRPVRPAAMPEAPVDEHRESKAGEDDVWPNPMAVAQRQTRVLEKA